MKKLLFTFLAALCCTVAAFANGININGIYYILDTANKTAEVTYTGEYSTQSDYAGSISIPSTVNFEDNNYTVTSIGKYAFFKCLNLTSVAIPESVTSIGKYAFYYCLNLTSVAIPESVTSIGENAFESCQSLTSVTIPEGIVSIEDYTFESCESLTSVTIPESVKSIGRRAFHSCYNLTSIIIPSAVTNIGDLSFARYKSLTQMMFNGDAPKNLENLSNLEQEGAPYDEVHGVINYLDDPEPYPVIVVCDEYKDNYTYFSNHGHKITLLSDFKKELESEITNAQNKVNDFTEQEITTINSCITAISSATTPGVAFTKKEITLSIIKLHVVRNDAITELNDLVKDMVGVDISSYTTAINGATSTDQVDELVKQAKTEINGMTFATIGTLMYKLDKDNDAYTYGNSVTINDKDFYQSGNDFTVTGSITYNRTFNNTNWQPLYVPFAISYDEWKGNFDVAAINNFHEYTDADGKTVKTELEIRMVKSGTLKPNHPYLIKAHDAAAEPQEINLTTKEISKSDNKSYSCSSMESQYTFTGTYQEMNKLKTNDYIFMSGGKLCKAEDDEVKLSAQRWYLKITSLGSQVDGGNTSDVKAMEFDIKLLDDEPTGIDEITVTRTPLTDDSETIYNLNGMRVNEGYKGIVIKNGKKYVVK